MEKYHLRGQEGRVERLLEEIQSSPNRMYDIDSVKYNFDNCEYQRIRGLCTHRPSNDGENSIWWAVRDSNPRPTECKSVALIN